MILKGLNRSNTDVHRLQEDCNSAESTHNIFTNTVSNTNTIFMSKRMRTARA